MQLVIIVTTVDSKATAQAMARRMVEERLAACVQILSCESHYVYEGRQEATNEWRLEMKTTEAAQDRLMARVEEVHPYDVPEVIVLPMMSASQAYAEWVRTSVTT
ncbi:MAG: divalent-cation tolerance protein CutA [Pseudomonadota bacterium]